MIRLRAAIRKVFAHRGGQAEQAGVAGESPSDERITK